MDRRTYLAMVPTAALLAGCGSRQNASPEAETDPANGPDASDEAPPGDDEQAAFWQPRDDIDQQRDPTVVEFETAPYTGSVVGGRGRTADGISVTLDFERGATAESPATLTATVVNTRPYEQTVESRRLPVLDDPPVGRTDDRAVAYLAPTETHPLAETTPEAERDDGQWRVDTVGPDWFPKRVTFPPESGFVAEYQLLGHHDRTEPPLDPGQYQFRWQGDEFSIALWETEQPGPTDESAFAGESVPSLADEMVWYHESTRTTEVSLRPDAEVVAPPAKVSFALVNHSNEQLRGNPYFWRLSKLVDGEWHPVHPWQWPQPLASVVPGGRDETALALFAGEPVAREGERTVGHLGGGRYAYKVGYSRDHETYAAMLELDAPDLSVAVADDAEIVDEGETVVVELPNHSDARRQAVFEVTRATDDPGRQLIPEQLPRRPFRGYRNSLPLFDSGVETVRVRTDRGTALEPFGYEEGTTRIVEYGGAQYRASGELLGE